MIGSCSARHGALGMALGMLCTWHTTRAQSVGGFLYVPRMDGAIAALRVDANHGALTRAAGVPGTTAVAGDQSVRAPLVVANRFVYLLSLNAIVGYEIQVDGSLKPLAGSPFTTQISVEGAIPTMLAVDASGRFLFGISTYGRSVAMLAIDPATGALHPTAGSPYRIGVRGVNTELVAADPAGPFVYVYNALNLSMMIWRVDAAGGALIPAPAQIPVSVPGWSPVAVAIEPTGRFMYIAQRGGPGTAIVQYAIDQSTGALAVVGDPVGVGLQPSQMSIDPLGRFLYVPEGQFIEGLRIDPTSGRLTPLPASPYLSGINTGSVTVHPSGQFAYAAFSADSIEILAVDPDTGALQFNGALQVGQEAGGMAVAGTAAAPRVAAPPTIMASSRNPQSDPNLPAQQGPLPLSVRWAYVNGSSIPWVWFSGGLSDESGRHARYLGFNDEGSWLEHPQDHRIFVWRDNPIGLEKRYASRAEMPAALLANLKNAPDN